MFEVHFRRDVGSREDFVFLGRFGSLSEAAGARRVSGDLVVGSGTGLVVDSDDWLFGWEKDDDSCYARRAMLIDRGL